MINNYTTLVQAIIDTAEDDGSEFLSYIDTAIDLAEELLFKEIDLPDLETKVTGTMIPGVVTINKPTGYRFANYIKIMVPEVINPLNINNVFLKRRRDDYVQDYWPNSLLTEQPKYYADSALTTFTIAPTPDAAYTYEIKFTAQPAKLTSINLTNYYTDRCADLLFAATMLQQVRFMKAWSQVQVWQASYDALKGGWNLEMSRTRRDDGQIPHNPTGGPNTLRHSTTSNS